MLGRAVAAERDHFESATGVRCDAKLQQLGAFQCPPVLRRENLSIRLPSNGNHGLQLPLGPVCEIRQTLLLLPIDSM